MPHLSHFRHADVVPHDLNSENPHEIYEQIRTGNAYFYKQVSKCPNHEALETAEAIASRAKVGVYSGDYEKPWDYRKAQRNSSQGT